MHPTLVLICCQSNRQNFDLWFLLKKFCRWRCMLCLYSLSLLVITTLLFLYVFQTSCCCCEQKVQDQPESSNDTFNHVHGFGLSFFPVLLIRESLKRHLLKRKRHRLSLKLVLTPKRTVIPCVWSVSNNVPLSPGITHTLMLSPEEGHAALLPSWPAGGQREQLYKSWLYKNTGRRSSWELILPRQPQTVNYKGLTWFLRSPGTSNSQPGCVKLAQLAPLQMCFSLLFHCIRSIP